MPKYHFRLRSGGQILPDDDEPEEFQDLAAAKANAIRSAREILSEAAFAGEAASLNSQVEVHNETGGPIFVVSCGRVVDTDAQG